MKQEIKVIAQEMIGIWLGRGTFETETETLIIITQNNAIKTISQQKLNSQEKSKGKICGDKDERWPSG